MYNSNEKNNNKIVPYLHAIGTALPPTRISQQAYEDILQQAAGDDRRQKLSLRKIYAGSGIDYRYTVLPEFGNMDTEGHAVFRPLPGQEQASTAVRMELYEQHALPLATAAINNCFSKLKDFDPASITHVVTFSCTGMYAPGLDIEIVNSFGLSRNVERTCINFMGCYAAINALKTAAHISRSDANAIVLVTGVELCTLHYQRSNDPEQLIANAIFSDGAAAGIISCRHIAHNGSGIALSLDRFYAEFEHSGAGDMVWRVGNNGFDIHLSSDVPARLESSIHSLITKLLDKQDMTLEDITHFAIHPGGVRILQACESALGIGHERNTFSYDVLRSYGNMSSVTVMFVLEKYLSSLKDAGESVLACAFGPGLTMEAMLATTCNPLSHPQSRSLMAEKQLR